MIILISELIMQTPSSFIPAAWMSCVLNCRKCDPVGLDLVWLTIAIPLNISYSGVDNCLPFNWLEAPDHIHGRLV